MKRTDLNTDETKRLFEQLFPGMKIKHIAARTKISETTLWRYSQVGLPRDRVPAVLDAARKLRDYLNDKVEIWETRLGDETEPSA